MATATKTVDIGKLITKSPNVYHGLPVIAGTKIPVMIIVGMHKEGASEADIARRKYLTLAQVHAALAYYYANQQQVDKETKEEEAENKRLEKQARQMQTRDPV